MSLKVTKLEVWSGEIRDRPGGLAGALRELAGAGASLEMLVARRQPDRPGSGIVFLAPVTGRKAVSAAALAGLAPTAGVSALRIEGTDRPGLGAQLTGAIADAGINLRGLSAAVVGGRFAAYLAFDSREDAEKAAKLIRAAGAAKTARKKPRRR
jgi:predicted amino acid-binding ACT domain protein